MWIVAILCVGTVLVWYSNKRRAQRFVRAVHFLDLLDSGANTDEANGKVARLFTKHSTPDMDVAAIEDATDKANRLTEGKQLPWIDEARQHGFTIDSGDTRFDMAHLSQAQPKADQPQDFSADFSEGQYTTAQGGSFPQYPIHSDGRLPCRVWEDRSQQRRAEFCLTGDHLHWRALGRAGRSGGVCFRPCRPEDWGSQLL